MYENKEGQAQNYQTILEYTTDILLNASKVLENEANALLSIKNQLDEHFVEAVKLIHKSRGRLIVTGIGKSAHVANKLVATFNSTGTPSIFLHAAEAIHGDLGMIQREDILICLSKSGSSQEIQVLLPLIKRGNNPIIAICGNQHSFLAQNADLLISSFISEEACPNDLAPTTSTIAQMAIGDALAVCLIQLKGFSKEDFAQYHPGGALGKRLYLRNRDLCADHKKPSVLENSTIPEVIENITSNRLGATAVLDQNQKVIGIITDGDIRRMLGNNSDFSKLSAKDVMGNKPTTLSASDFVVKAHEIMQQQSINHVIILDEEEYLGILHIQDLINEGIV